MVPLGIGIGDVCLTHPQHLFQQGSICKRCPTQRSPILPLAARDHVVNGGQGELLMGEMTVSHEMII